ncbi:uncharacterized protein LOC134531938 isoform X2 [Bacillus rossius redtenbacheri]|uniref:uncharacterized protein LOC134531938 isoform X2 n=1 Tax=Bacillus rossius redtenbacheri TaxID=93214 RepID=UPI002FDCFF99
MTRELVRISVIAANVWAKLIAMSGEVMLTFVIYRSVAAWPGFVRRESAECSAGPGRDGSCSDRDTSADSTNYFADAETAEWFQSLAAQATVLAVEHEKMAEMLGLQRQFDLQESRLRSELESCRRDRLTTRRWRDQLLRDKLAEVEAATSEMKQLVSQLDEASPCWRNKVRFAEMF